MKKILFTLLLICFLSRVQGQVGPGTIIKSDVTSPSPQAFALTKYGDIPINEFTGMVSATIPIYTAKVGKLELPISLNYAAAGVKVAQLPTWTGINWTLNAGGVITRTINDAPDESISADKRFIPEMIIPNQLINGSSHAYFLTGVMLGARKHYDFKPDLWSFSFGNYSGTFYLDADFVPQLSKRDTNLKIEIIGSESDLKERFRNNQAFCITTADGIKYFFGGQGACESSFMGSHRDNPYANTGFYLTKVQHPDYGILMFEYENDSLTHEVWTGQEENVTINVLETYEGTLCMRPPTTEGQHIISTSGITTRDGKWLKRIYSPLSYLEIQFNRSHGSSGHYRYVLDGIEVKEGSTVVRRADFSYLFPQLKTNSERFFLTKVEFDKNLNYGSGHGRKNEEYLIEYNDPLALPGRRSEAKDMAGFYNGAISNTTGLPINEDLQFNNYYPNLANRTPIFMYMAKGTLSKITYPTKGYTVFEYESLKAKDYDRQHRSLTIYRNYPNRIPASKTHTSLLLGNFIQNPDGTFGTSTAVIDEEIKVRLELTANNWMGHTDRVLFKLLDQTTNTTQTVTIQMPDGNQELGSGAFNYTREFTVNVVKDHLYTVELTNTYSSTVQFEATAYFFYTKGFKTIDENGSLRVLRTTDYSANDVSSYVKRYYYSKAKDVYSDPYSNIAFKRNYSFVKDLNLTKCCNPSGGDWMNRTGIINLRVFSSAMPYTDVFDTKYNFVTISYGGDNFELGGKQKEFNNTYYSTFQEIHPFYNSPFQMEMASYKGNLESIYQGTLLSEVDLIRRGNSLLKVKEKTFEYDYRPIGNSIGGVCGGYAFMNCVYPQDGVDNLDLAKFEFLSKKVSLLSTLEKDFMVPMPVSTDQIFESNYKPIVQRTDYEYGNLIGLPISITSNTSDGSEVNRVEYVYADQPSNVPEITANQISALNSLVEMNKISQPIVERNYRGLGSGNLLGTKVTTYKVWNNQPKLVLPEVLSFSKGSNPLENRVFYHLYDSRGNLLLSSSANGAKTRYEYDSYDNLKIKVEAFNGGDLSLIEVPNIPLNFEPGTPGPCNMVGNYAGGLVTLYYYDTYLRLLRRTVDTNCRSTFYEYDPLLRLKKIKDHDGNIIEEYDHSYRLN